MAQWTPPGRLRAQAPIGIVLLNDYYGVEGQTMVARMYGTMFVNARTMTIYFFDEKLQVFFTSSGWVYLDEDGNEPDGPPLDPEAGATYGRSRFELSDELNDYPAEALEDHWFRRHLFLVLLVRRWMDSLRRLYCRSIAM